MSHPLESVILLHGFASHPIVMTRLARGLKDEGFQAWNWGYRSVRPSIESHAARLAERIEEFVQRQQPSRLHLVTHSMGSLVARRALQLRTPESLGRIVMLGPPNFGSHAARRLARPLGKICPPLSEMSDDPESYVNQLKDNCEAEVGVIAAAWDHVVSLSSTKLSYQRDHITLPSMHGALPLWQMTRRQVVHFLRHGRFEGGQIDGVVAR